MLNSSVNRVGNEVIEVKVVVKQLECNSHDSHRPIGSRAIAGALARVSTISNGSDELQCALSPSAWQQWLDWDNGHVDS